MLSSTSDGGAEGTVDKNTSEGLRLSEQQITIAGRISKFLIGFRRYLIAFKESLKLATF